MEEGDFSPHRCNYFAMKTRLLFSLVLLLVGLFTTSTAAAATRFDPTRQANSFFKQAIPTPGTSVQNVWVVPDRLLARQITVTSDINGVITASAALEGGSGGTINGTLVWTNNYHWKLTFVATSTATSASSPTNGINLNHVDGFIKNVGGAKHAQLTLRGYSIGESTVDINLSIVRGGFEGTSEITNLVLGKTTYPRVKLSVSSLQRAARLEGTMQSDQGTFTIDAFVNGPTMGLDITGADLAFKTESFQITEFRMKTTVTVPASGCSTISGFQSGTVVMKRKTYTLHEGSMRMVCGQLIEFKLALDIVHQTSPVEVYTGRLRLALDRDGGTFTELTQGQNNNGWQLASREVSYGTALAGAVSMSRTRGIRKRVRGRTFSRTMTIGMVFGVSIYTNPGASKYYGFVGAGGGFDADRLSGGFGCSYASQASDFSCRGTVRIDPSWAGVYRIGVTV